MKCSSSLYLVLAVAVASASACATSDPVGTDDGSVSGSGGKTGSGGNITGSGGKLGSGGNVTGSGGKLGSGGNVTGSGGKLGSGGNTGSGGKLGSGGSTGSGGGTTSCTITGSPSAGSGSFTNYYFSQGSYQEGGFYRTACGYRGTEPSGASSDKVNNIANGGFFAAIPGQNGFDSKSRCGGCVQVTNGGKSAVFTIIDECPYGSDGSNPPCAANPNGHLDLSKAGFDTLGYATGNPTGTTWKFVPCPVTGNVKIRIKPGNPNEIYIENVILPVQSVTMNGSQATRQSYGAWHFGGNIPSGTTLTITDTSGRSITVTVSSTTADQDQDTGKQFPACS